MNSPVDHILRLQYGATRRGHLPMWTIYEKPKDFPDSYVARMFEVAKEPVATHHTIRSDQLEPLRAAFAQAGLVCMARSPEDDPKIVEVWL